MDEDLLVRLSKILPEDFVNLFEAPVMLEVDGEEMVLSFNLILSENCLVLLEQCHACLVALNRRDALIYREALKEEIPESFLDLILAHAYKGDFKRISVH